MMMQSLMPATSPGDAARWRAVLDRDRTADGTFVYGVASTGIFCRPSCPSRRPHRDRVRFFTTPGEAYAAGYRACLRCRPADAAPADPWAARIDAACRLLSRAESPLSLVVLARRVGTSPFHLQRNFTRLVGLTPREFAEARRFAVVKQELRTQPDVTSAIVAAGYGSSSRFYERAAPKLGMAPSRYHAGAAGETIRYVTDVLPAGVVLLAATGRGICAVSLGESADRLIADLRAEFPEAVLEPGADDLRAWVSRVVAQVAGDPHPLDLPLDIRATAFQWRVWTALAAIPRGLTRTYAEVAASIGRPTSARAVARACAANPVALVIPCHRVVPASGGTGGYRWGATRKEALLAAESGRAVDAASGARPPARVRRDPATARGRIAGHEPR